MSARLAHQLGLGNIDPETAWTIVNLDNELLKLEKQRLHAENEMLRAKVSTLLEENAVLTQNVIAWNARGDVLEGERASTTASGVESESVSTTPRTAPPAHLLLDGPVARPAFAPTDPTTQALAPVIRVSGPTAAAETITIAAVARPASSTVVPAPAPASSSSVHPQPFQSHAPLVSGLDASEAEVLGLRRVLALLSAEEVKRYEIYAALYNSSESDVREDVFMERVRVLLMGPRVLAGLSSAEVRKRRAVYEEFVTCMERRRMARRAGPSGV